MNKVIIIGGGFAGLAAAARLGKSNLDLEVILIDKQKEFNFLPMLPDIIGRAIMPRFVTNRIEDLSKAFGFNFINQEVVRVDLEKKEVSTNLQILNYDYLIIACGSQTNFYGNENIKKYAYKLDNAQDAELILRALENNKLDSYIVAGGGYTGIEIATNLRVYFEKRAKDKRIIIVERAPTILGPLPEWLKDYVLANLKELNIELYLNTVIEKIEGGRILLSSQNAFEKPL
jgi:NADH dehydrogenase